MVAVFIYATTAVVLGQHTVLAACSPPSATYGSVTMTYDVPTGGLFRVWSRISAPDAVNNSYFLINDGGCATDVGDAVIPAGSFIWVDYQDGNVNAKTNLSLTAGRHTMVLVGREPNVKVDRVILSAAANCVPAGNGDNCASYVAVSPATPSPKTPPTSIIVPPTSSQPVQPYLPPASSPLVASGQVQLITNGTKTQNVALKIDGQLIKIASDGRIDTTLLPNGTHDITITSTDPATGKTITTSRKIKVENKLNPLQYLLNALYLPFHGNKLLINFALAIMGIAILIGVALLLKRFRKRYTPQTM